jgi:hypothetical protein
MESGNTGIGTAGTLPGSVPAMFGGSWPGFLGGKEQLLLPAS